MSDPRFLVTFGIVFLLLGLYNVFTGYKRLRMTQKQGIALKWYRQKLLLIGFEYILLSLVFLFRLAVMNKWLPQSLNILIIPFYIVVLVPSAVIAGLIVRQGIASLRPSRQVAVQPARAAVGNEDEVVQQRHAVQQQHRRERRQKAAAARRRKAGRA